jgi:hypothetical protein
MKIKNKLGPLLFSLALFQTIHGAAQQTLLRKNLVRQESRNASYSVRQRYSTNNFQIGNLVRTVSNDSLSTARGMSSWVYGMGTGIFFPVAGPVWFNVDLMYQYRNYRMRSNDESILAQVDRLQKHKIALHTLSASAYLRLSTTKNKPLQGKFIDIGFNLGYHFANRLILIQGADPAAAWGAKQVKSKFKNTTFLSAWSQQLCVRVGRESLSLFAEYRINDFFRRSEHVYSNQSLPEISPLSLGITLLLTDEPRTQNTDEAENSEE